MGRLGEIGGWRPGAAIATAVAISAVAIGGCGHDKGPVYIDRLPPITLRFAHLATPTCTDRKDPSLANACWRVRPTSGTRFVAVTASCGISDDGTVDCWKKYLVHKPSGRFQAIADNDRDACAARSSGGVVCWGRSTWPNAPADETFTRLVVGPRGLHYADDEPVTTACGLTGAGTIECWDSGPLPSKEVHCSGGPFKDVALGEGSILGWTTDGTLVDAVHPSRKLTGEPVQTFSAGTTTAESRSAGRPIAGATRPADWPGLGLHGFTRTFSASRRSMAA